MRLQHQLYCSRDFGWSFECCGGRFWRLLFVCFYLILYFLYLLYFSSFCLPFHFLGKAHLKHTLFRYVTLCDSEKQELNTSASRKPVFAFSLYALSQIKNRQLTSPTMKWSKISCKGKVLWLGPKKVGCKQAGPWNLEKTIEVVSENSTPQKNNFFGSSNLDLV